MEPLQKQQHITVASSSVVFSTPTFFSFSSTWKRCFWLPPPHSGKAPASLSSGGALYVYARTIRSRERFPCRSARVGLRNETGRASREAARATDREKLFQERRRASKEAIMEKVWKRKKLKVGGKEGGRQGRLLRNDPTDHRSAPKTRRAILLPLGNQCLYCAVPGGGRNDCCWFVRPVFCFAFYFWCPRFS